ncbi:MAG TPA: CopG family transcriptional regulator [Dehalococcoidia bacterium]|nr:CopG family transcriptional regulator [Dehalococcoidia bacterium]
MTRRLRVGDKVRVNLGGKVKEFILGPDIDLDKEIFLDNDGQRITEARAQEIARETMAEYDRRVGRPPLDRRNESIHSPQVSFRLSERLARKAHDRAAREGKTMSQIGREALERYLDQEAGG